LEECFDDEDVKEILDSVSDLFEELLHFGSEDEFINWCSNREKSKKNIYVYTMAQYISGCSRRTLIPAICELYGFININANAYMSAIGCNKETMYKLLASEGAEDLLAPSMFFNIHSDTNYHDIVHRLGKDIILKPINESCCIDVEVLINATETEFKKVSQRLLDQYGSFLVQRYIKGKEIGVTVFFIDKKSYILTPIEIKFLSGKEYLTHVDSYYTNYELLEYSLPKYIIESCKKMSYILGFYCTTRYDFRYDGENYYLFDISPNPTVNGFTSSNYAARSTLCSDHRGILRLMVYEKFSLFEPSFYGTE
jgi:D-alanine-D-alanine ligase-like ATP-grasp enzyme